MSDIGPVAGPWEPYDRLILRTPNLVAYWPNAELQGIVAADIKGGRNGTHVAGPTLGAIGPIKGETFNPAVLYNGSTQWTTIEAYHIVPATVKKLPKRLFKYALPLGTTFFMTFLVTGVATYRVLGWDKAMFEMWATSWMIAWVVACPAMYVIMPLVRRALTKIIEEP